MQAPIFGFSGSIPPSTIGEFVTLTNTTWLVVRTPSNRPELAYSVIRTPVDPVERIIADVPGYLEEYEPGDRMMIFCRSHNDVERVSTALGVPGFTSRTTDTNEATMMDWRSGKHQVIVSTSILGCGLDYPSVRHVLHCGIAHSMIDQHQQESRAGRDSLRALAITYVSASSRRPIKIAKELYGLGELHDWSASPNQCLRIIPSSYLDGVPVTCSLLPRCELCSFCAEQMQMPPPQRVVSLSRFIGDAVSMPAPRITSSMPAATAPLRVFIPPPENPPIALAVQSAVSPPASSIPWADR